MKYFLSIRYELPRWIQATRRILLGVEVSYQIGTIGDTGKN